MLRALILAALIAVPAHAQDTCAAWGSLAETTMKARQDGVSLSDLMGAADRADPEIGAIIRAMVLTAFEKPRFTTPTVQQRTIADFRNDVELGCYTHGEFQ